MMDDTHLDAIVDFAARASRGPSAKPRAWSAAELAYVHACLGEQSYEEIARQLGRSAAAVKIAQVRYRLGAPSRRAGFLTGGQVARILGTDTHAVGRWVALGLLPAGRVAGRRGILRIAKSALYRFAVNPDNWIYFRTDRVRDPALARLIARKQALWGDEWWTTGQVARHFGLASTSAITTAIQRGKLPARRWGNWYVRRSDALRYGFGRSRRRKTRVCSPAADAFLLRARQEWGLSFAAIDRLMKTYRGWAAYRYARLVGKAAESRGQTGIGGAR